MPASKLSNQVTRLEEEFNLNPLGIVADLSHIQRLSLEGIPTEKCTPRGGVIVIREAHPDVFIRCQKLKFEIYKWCIANDVSDVDIPQVSLLPPLEVSRDVEESEELEGGV